MTDCERRRKGLVLVRLQVLRVALGLERRRDRSGGTRGRLSKTRRDSGRARWMAEGIEIPWCGGSTMRTRQARRAEWLQSVIRSAKPRGAFRQRFTAWFGGLPPII